MFKPFNIVFLLHLRVTSLLFDGRTMDINCCTPSSTFVNPLLNEGHFSRFSVHSCPDHVGENVSPLLSVCLHFQWVNLYYPILSCDMHLLLLFRNWCSLYNICMLVVIFDLHYSFVSNVNPIFSPLWISVLSSVGTFIG